MNTTFHRSGAPALGAAVLLAITISFGGLARAQAPVFDRAWGTHGSSHGQFDYPQGVAADNSGVIYVADTGNSRIQKFTGTGTFLLAWGLEGSLNGYFESPGGIAVNSGGTAVLVADTENHRIQKFNSDSTYVTQWGSLGSTNGKFMYPNAVALGSGDTVYVADTGNNRVQKFSPSGVFIAAWGTLGTADGQFNSPIGIAVDASDNVYVTDNLNGRVQKFSRTGQFLAKWNRLSSAPADTFNSPYGIAVERNTSRVFVIDQLRDLASRFSSAGAFQLSWGATGSGNGQFDLPTGITVDGQANEYVADTNNHRIEKFRPQSSGAVGDPGGMPAFTLGGAPNPARFGHVLYFTLPRAGAVRLGIYSTGGRRLVDRDLGTLDAGAHSWSWNLFQDSGLRVPEGVYIARIEAAGESRTFKIVAIR